MVGAIQNNRWSLWIALQGWVVKHTKRHDGSTPFLAAGQSGQGRGGIKSQEEAPNGGRQKAKKSELAGITRSEQTTFYNKLLSSHRTSAAAPPISNRKSSTVVFERRRSDSSSRIPRHLGLEPSRLEIVTNIFPIVKYNSINVWKIGKTQVDWVREHQIRWSGHELRWKDYQRWRRLGETARSSSDGTRRKS